MRKTTLFQIIHNTTVTGYKYNDAKNSFYTGTPHTTPLGLVHKACPWENPLETNVSFYVHGQDAFVPVHKNANTLLSTLYHTP